MCCATGWTFEYVWNTLSYSLVVSLLDYLPEHYYRQHASTARLGFAVESFMGAKHASFVEFLEPWMRPRASERARAEAFYPMEVVAGVNLAFDLGFLSQAALVALGPQRLRASGAFARDRSTDVSVGR